MDRGWRQCDLARAARVSDAAVSRVERGRIEGVTAGVLDRLARALDIRVQLVVEWRGGDLARLVNRRHAALHESVVRWFATLAGWSLAPEVSFSVWGERGAIDLLAWHAASASLLVIELKSEIVDVQELIGIVDRKRRLAPGIAAGRGWHATAAGAWVIVGESRTNRRRLAAHRAVLRAAFPADGRSVEAWLRRPGPAPLAALSFWPDSRAVSTTHVGRPRRRVRRGRAAEPCSGTGRRVSLDGALDHGSDRVDEARFARLVARSADERSRRGDELSRRPGEGPSRPADHA